MNDERHAHHLRVERGDVTEVAVLPVLVAVIGGKNQQGGIKSLHLPQGVQQATYLFIHGSYLAVVILQQGLTLAFNRHPDSPFFRGTRAASALAMQWAEVPDEDRNKLFDYKIDLGNWAFRNLTEFPGTAASGAATKMFAKQPYLLTRVGAQEGRRKNELPPAIIAELA